MNDELIARVAACERDNARLRVQLKRQNRAWIAAVLAVAIGSATAGVATKTAMFDSIQAKDITIVDQNGVVRARMSGDMPDAVMFGGRVAKRGAQAAGFMIYDKDGIERGGYVTFDHDNAMLSLDSKYSMVASLIAGPDKDSTSVLDLYGSRHALSLRSDVNGSRISISADHVVQQQIPAIERIDAESCTEYRTWAKQEPDKNWCRTRYTEAACSACLKGQP